MRSDSFNPRHLAAAQLLIAAVCCLSFTSSLLLQAEAVTTVHGMYTPSSRTCDPNTTDATNSYFQAGVCNLGNLVYYCDASYVYTYSYNDAQCTDLYSVFREPLDCYSYVFRECLDIASGPAPPAYPPKGAWAGTRSCFDRSTSSAATTCETSDIVRCTDGVLRMGGCRQEGVRNSVLGTRYVVSPDRQYVGYLSYGDAAGCSPNTLVAATVDSVGCLAGGEYSNGVYRTAPSVAELPTLTADMILPANLPTVGSTACTTPFVNVTGLHANLLASTGCTNSITYRCSADAQSVYIEGHVDGGINGTCLSNVTSNTQTAAVNSCYSGRNYTCSFSMPASAYVPVTAGSSTASSQPSQSTGGSGGDSGNGTMSSSSTGSAPPSSGGSPIIVYFRLNYDVATIPADFNVPLRTDISTALGINSALVEILSIVAGSIVARVQFSSNPAYPAPDPVQLASSFIAQVNDVNSALFQQSVTKNTIVNSAAVDNGTGGATSDDNGSGLNTKVGGVRAWVILLIFIFLLILGISLFVWIRRCCKGKTKTISQRMTSSQKSDMIDQELGHLSNRQNKYQRQI